MQNGIGEDLVLFSLCSSRGDGVKLSFGGGGTTPRVKSNYKRMFVVIECANCELQTVFMYIDISYLMVGFRNDAWRFLVFDHKGKMKHIGHIEFSCFRIDHLKL